MVVEDSEETWATGLLGETEMRLKPQGDEWWVLLCMLLVLLPVLGMTIGMYDTYKSSFSEVYATRLTGWVSIRYSMGSHPLYVYVLTLLGVWCSLLCMVLYLYRHQKSQEDIG